MWQCCIFVYLYVPTKASIPGCTSNTWILHIHSIRLAPFAEYLPRIWENVQREENHSSASRFALDSFHNKTVYSLYVCIHILYRNSLLPQSIIIYFKCYIFFSYIIYHIALFFIICKYYTELVFSYLKRKYFIHFFLCVCE